MDCDCGMEGCADLPDGWIHVRTKDEYFLRIWQYDRLPYYVTVCQGAIYIVNVMRKGIPSLCCFQMDTLVEAAEKGLFAMTAFADNDPGDAAFIDIENQSRVERQRLRDAMIAEDPTWKDTFALFAEKSESD